MRTPSSLIVLMVFFAGCTVGVDGISDGGAAGADAAGAVADAGAGSDAAPPSPRCYEEPAYPDADIGDLVAAYGGPGWKDQLIEAMTRRHPATGWLLEHQRNDSYFDQFSDPSSWSGMVGWLDTLSHEQTHLFNAYHAIGEGQPAALYFSPDHIVYLPAVAGFPRADIRPHLSDETRDGLYARTYLAGAQGQRGINPLLDEQSAYLTELAAVSLVGEYYPGLGVSLRDGSVAFLYFVTVYLRVARTEHPALYQQLRDSAAYRDAVATQWLRTFFFLEYADAFPNLGIHDAVYRAELSRPETLAEIELFTGLAVDASPCLLD
jgi:hypothetical protein